MKVLEDEKLYICDHANHVGCSFNCSHKIPHIMNHICKEDLCLINNITVKCVRVFKDIIFIKENEFMI